MRKRIITICATLITGTVIMLAQSQNLDRINEIKRQSDLYFWSQYAHPNADSALVNSTRWLMLHVNDGRDDDDLVTEEQISPFVKYIKMERGGVVRAFSYIKKIDVPTAKDVGEDNITSIPDIPKSDAQISLRTDRAFVPDVFVQKIMNIGDFQAVYRHLRAMKAEGEILQFGPLKDIEDYSSMDLILFDMTSGKVISLLSGVTQDGNRTNMVTGKSDSLDNYPDDMTAVIWYIRQ